MSLKARFYFSLKSQPTSSHPAAARPRYACLSTHGRRPRHCLTDGPNKISRSHPLFPRAHHPHCRPLSAAFRRTQQRPSMSGPRVASLPFHCLRIATSLTRSIISLVQFEPDRSSPLPTKHSLPVPAGYEHAVAAT